MMVSDDEAYRIYLPYMLKIRNCYAIIAHNMHGKRTFL